MRPNNEHFAVLFDMDGVLVDNKEVHTESWGEFCNAHHIQVTRKELESLFGKTNRDYLRYLFKREITDEEVLTYKIEKEGIYRDLFSKTIKPVKGLPTFLEDLKKNGVKIAVGTSGPMDNVRFVIESTNIQGYFEAIVCEEDLKKGKPDPEVYLKAAQKVNTEPGRCIVIEDSVVGIKSGKNAGMKVIALTTTNEAEALTEADLIVKNFTELSYEKALALIN